MARTPNPDYDERFTIDGVDPENLARLLVNTPPDAKVDEADCEAEELDEPAKSGDG